MHILSMPMILWKFSKNSKESSFGKISLKHALSFPLLQEDKSFLGICTGEDGGLTASTMIFLNYKLVLALKFEFSLTIFKRWLA